MEVTNSGAALEFAVEQVSDFEESCRFFFVVRDGFETDRRTKLGQRCEVRVARGSLDRPGRAVILASRVYPTAGFLFLVQSNTNLRTWVVQVQMNVVVSDDHATSWNELIVDQIEILEACHQTSDTLRA